jgi:hypothetical protein
MAGFFVRRIRFELTRPVVWALPPQGSASTNFATAAVGKVCKFNEPLLK